MSKVCEIVRFRSARFSPILPEGSQVNPGRYGAELAFWLCTTLFVKFGVATSYPEFEDWGWILTYVSETGAEFVLQCNNVEGTNDCWVLSLQGFGPKVFGMGKPDFTSADELIENVKKLLECEEGIQDIQWLYPR